jgi:hypothetical protein
MGEGQSIGVSYVWPVLSLTARADSRIPSVKWGDWFADIFKRNVPGVVVNESDRFSIDLAPILFALVDPRRQLGEFVIFVLNVEDLKNDQMRGPQCAVPDGRLRVRV